MGSWRRQVFCIATLAALGYHVAAELAPNEPDRCEGIDPLEASSFCSAENCLCRLQQQRAGAGSGNFFSIAEGCFAVQSCPEQEAKATTEEEVKCVLGAKGEMSVVRFDDENYDSHVSTTTQGDGTILTFPKGLKAGAEVLIKYDAVGESGLAVGIGFGCDGFVYLLGQDKSSGKASCGDEVDSNGKCVGACPSCALCGKGGATTGAYSFIFKPSSFQTVESFLSGSTLSGVIYFESTSSLQCTEVGSSFYCSGSESSSQVTISCALASVFEEENISDPAPSQASKSSSFAIVALVVFSTSNLHWF